MAIKVYHSGQAGSPDLSGLNGALIAVLDAVLVTGYNSVGISSITSSGATATVVCSGNHGLATGDSALISGAAQTAYNIDAVVFVVDALTFTYPVQGAPASPATGTMTVKRAPAGFTKVFAATNKAAYRSNHPQTTSPVLQVIDASATAGAAKEAQIRGYRTMSDIDTGAEPFPTIAQYATGLFAYKSNASSNAERPWVLITDGRTLYFQACMDQAPTSMQASGGYLWWFGFGDINSSRPNDVFSGFLAGSHAPNQQTSGSSDSNHNGMFRPAVRTSNPTSGCCYVVRSFSEVLGAAIMNQMGHGWDQNALGSLAMFGYPHPTDNGFMMTPVLCMQGGVMRGKMPGVYEPLQGRCLNQFDIVENVDGYPGRKFMALWGLDAGSTSTTGMLMFDITGPWS